MNKTTNGINGGKIIGNRHSQGGEQAVVISNSLSKDGMPIEVEDGEVIINRKAVLSNESFEFNGKKMKPCEILSEINQKFGGVKIPCDKVIYSKTKKGIFEKGGKLKHYKDERVRIGDYEVDIAKIYKNKDKYKVVKVPLSKLNTLTESENKIRNIKTGKKDIVGIYTVFNNHLFLIDGNHRTEQLKRNNIPQANYIYVPFDELKQNAKNISNIRVAKIEIIKFAKKNNIFIDKIESNRNHIKLLMGKTNESKKTLFENYINRVKKSTKLNIILKWK